MLNRRLIAAAALAASLALAAPAPGQAPVDPDQDPFYSPPKQQAKQAKRGQILDSEHIALADSPG